MYGSKAGNLKGRKAGAPEVVPGTAEVRGSLDKELIRRIIRRHINEVKFCYERELTRNADAAGPRHGPVHHRRQRRGHGQHRAVLDPG